MDNPKSPLAAVRLAITLCGGALRTAATIGVSRNAVYLWRYGKARPTAKHAVALEHATGARVTREQMRPDITADWGR